MSNVVILWWMILVVTRALEKCVDGAPCPGQLWVQHEPMNRLDEGGSVSWKWRGAWCNPRKEIVVANDDTCLHMVVPLIGSQANHKILHSSDQTFGCMLEVWHSSSFDLCLQPMPEAAGD